MRYLLSFVWKQRRVPLGIDRVRHVLFFCSFLLFIFFGCSPSPFCLGSYRSAFFCERSKEPQPQIGWFLVLLLGFASASEFFFCFLFFFGGGCKLLLLLKFAFEVFVRVCFAAAAAAALHTASAPSSYYLHCLCGAPVLRICGALWISTRTTI